MSTFLPVGYGWPEIKMQQKLSQTSPFFLNGKPKTSPAASLFHNSLFMVGYLTSHIQNWRKGVSQGVFCKNKKIRNRMNSCRRTTALHSLILFRPILVMRYRSCIKQLSILLWHKCRYAKLTSYSWCLPRLLHQHIHCLQTLSNVCGTSLHFPRIYSIPAFDCCIMDLLNQSLQQNAVLSFSLFYMKNDFPINDSTGSDSHSAICADYKLIFIQAASSFASLLSWPSASKCMTFTNVSFRLKNIKKSPPILH